MTIPSLHPPPSPYLLLPPPISCSLLPLSPAPSLPHLLLPPPISCSLPPPISSCLPLSPARSLPLSPAPSLPLSPPASPYLLLPPTPFLSSLYPPAHLYPLPFPPPFLILGNLVHTSEYVYLPSYGHTTLCHTSNFQWTPNVDVHLIISCETSYYNYSWSCDSCPPPMQ